MPATFPIEQNYSEVGAAHSFKYKVLCCPQSPFKPKLSKFPVTSGLLKLLNKVAVGMK